MSDGQILNKKERKKEISNDLEVAHPQNGSLSGLTVLVELEFGNVGF